MTELFFRSGKTSSLKSFTGLLMLALLMLGTGLMAQDEEPVKKKRKPRPVRSTFGSTWIIDNQTVDVPIKGTFQMDILHRFGTIDKGYDDFIGIYAPSNIRIGFSYSPIKNLAVGFAFIKENLYWDFHGKYAIFTQSRKGGFPVSLTYFVNMGVNTNKESTFGFPDSVEFDGINRLSYFHQLLIARKITEGLSVQAGVSLSHFNFQRQIEVDTIGTRAGMSNNHIAVHASARYKFGTTFGIIANFDIPITMHDINQPDVNYSFGIEWTTSSHAFQFFLGNYVSLNPQVNNVFYRNTNTGWWENMRLGFNMTRLWNF